MYDFCVIYKLELVGIMAHLQYDRQEGRARPGVRVQMSIRLEQEL